jgi:hypothetical protein
LATSKSMWSSSAIIIIATIASAARAAEECSSLHLVYARATTEPPASVPRAVNASSEDYAKTFEAAALNLTTGSWSKGYGAAGASLLSNLTGVDMRSLTTSLDVRKGKKVEGFTPYVEGATGYPVHYPVRNSFLTSSSTFQFGQSC